MTKFNNIKISADILDTSSWLSDADLADIFFEESQSDYQGLSNYFNDVSNTHESDDFEIIFNSIVKEKNVNHLEDIKPNLDVVLNTELKERKEKFDTNNFIISSVEKAA